ncbi:MAG: hypothetical protein A2Z70_01360 [Chloroflexi bacterium RBG_13_48_17]|nr:MAG: hypothetical protein A2Z70_01360 [Chloroflexi bacterium RBG_13_48_17]
MNSRLGIILVLASLMFGSVTPALASDISGAVYYGKIRASNSSNVSAAVVAAVWSGNTSAWIAAGLLNATATNAAIRNSTGSDTEFMPGYGSNPWCVWYDSVPAYSNVDATLYIPATGGALRYFPGDAGATAANSTSLNLSTNWTITWRGYVDTDNATGKDFVVKTGALKVFVADNVSGNITGVINSSSYLNVHSATSAEGAWVEQSYPNAWVSSVRFQAYNSDAGGSQTVRLHEVQVFDDLTASWVSPTSNLAGPWSSLTNAYDGDTGTYASENPSALSFSGYATLTLSEAISSSKVRWWVSDPSGLITTKEMDIGVAASTYMSGVTSGEMTVTAISDGVNFWLTADTAAAHYGSANVTTAAVPDNGDDWEFCLNGAMLYVEYIEITVGGVQAAYWDWELGATFTDDSGNGNTLTPSYRSSSSDTDVSANMTAFAALELAQASGAGATTWGEMVTEAPTEPASAYTEDDRPGFFFEPLVHALWSLTDLPDSIFWYTFAFAIIIGAGVLVFYATAANQKDGLIIKIIVKSALMIFLALPGLNLYGMYAFVYYGFYAFGLIVISRSYGW